MKILFMTDAGDQTGIGGHLYSVQALVEALAPQVECVVVSVGSATSPALATLKCRQRQLVFGRGKLRLREMARFLKLVREENPDVIHAFDPIACAFARVAAQRTGCGLVLTKCGGPDPRGRYPRSYFPAVPRLVVFSEENERYFKAHRSFLKTRLWRIPNRINEIEPDPAKIAAIRARLDPASPVLLRIGRISPSYGKTAEQSIRLVKRLAADGVPTQLVFVGAVQDVRTEKAITDEMGNYGRVISDPDLVEKASAILDVGDLVVGTGRGLMEAASRGKIVLVPARSGRLPALVNEANWEGLFRANFSERCEVKPWDEERNYADILRALKDSGTRQQLSRFSRKLYEEHFALKRVVDQYLEIYTEARTPYRWPLLDMAKHWLWLIWRAWKRPLDAAPAPEQAN